MTIAIIIHPIHSQELEALDIVLSLNFDEENVLDGSQNKHLVTVHGGHPANGIKGNGYFLSGLNEYLEVVFKESLQIPSELTTSLWYQHERQNGSGFYSLIEQSANENGGHSRYGTGVFNGNQLMACIEPDACPDGSPLCQRCVVSNHRLKEGVWTHIAATYDGSILALYVNGTLDNERAFSEHTGISVRQYPLTIGTDPYDPSPIYLRGALDEIMVLRKAISENQIQQLYEVNSTTITDYVLAHDIPLIYPNPATNMLNIEVSRQVTAVKIYAANGSAYSFEIKNNRIDLSKLMTGIYILSIQMDNEVMFKKIVVN